MTRFPLLFVLPALLAPSALAAAPYNYGSSSKGTKTTAMATAAPTASSSPASSIHSVAVGEGGLKFVPDSFTAKVGDQIEFHFVSADHSVAEGSFSNACQPLDSSAWFSGYPVPVGGAPFTITVNSTDPMWFYCTATGHCQDGMVGVVNPPSGETVQDYVNAAAKTTKSSAPPKIQGGVFAKAKPASGSTTTMTGGSSPTTAAAASSSSSATPGAAAAQLLMGSIGVSFPMGLLGYLFL